MKSSTMFFLPLVCLSFPILGMDQNNRSTTQSPTKPVTVPSHTRANSAGAVSSTSLPSGSGSSSPASHASLLASSPTSYQNCKPWRSSKDV